MNPVLVIGATGRVGRQVTSQLATTGIPVRAIIRNLDSAALPPEVEVMPGDLSFPETLDQCLDGIETVFLVWSAPPTAVGPAVDRITRHARRIVFAAIGQPAFVTSTVA